MGLGNTQTAEAWKIRLNLTVYFVVKKTDFGWDYMVVICYEQSSGKIYNNPKSTPHSVLCQD